MAPASTGTSDERIESLRDGSPVAIRSIRPADAPGQSAFIDRLSADSRHLLFLGGIADLRDEELKRLCSPDHVREAPDPDDVHQVIYSMRLGPPAKE